MSNLTIYSLKGESYIFSIEDYFTVMNLKFLLSQKIHYQMKQILLCFQGQILKDSCYISTLIDDIIMNNELITYQIISCPFLGMNQTSEIFERNIIKKIDGIVSNSLNVNHRSKSKYQSYNEIQKIITDPFFEKSYDYQMKLEALCSLHPNQKESEKILRMFNCDINKSIEFFLNPSSFFAQTISDEQIIKQKEKKKQNQKQNPSKPYDYLTLMMNNSSQDYATHKKKKRKKSSYSKDQIYS